MNHKKTFTCLCAVLLLGATAISCASQADDKTKKETEPAVTETSTTEAETTDPIYDVLPQADYAGYTFRILNNISNFAYTNMGAEGQTGEALDDVIYARNARVEEALNIKLQIDDKEWEDNKNAIANSVKAGEDLYDVYFNELYLVLGHASNNYLLDMTQIESLDFDNPWWNKKAIASAAIGTPIYAAFGDLHLMYYECFVPVVFNKSIINNLDLDDPYQLVKDNRWTIDVMSSMMKEAKIDVDGDSAWTITDQYPIAVYAHNSTGFLTAANVSLISKNADGIPVWNGVSDQFATAYNKLISAIFADKTDNAANATGYQGDAGATLIHDMMKGGNVLFYIEPLGSIKKLRNVDYEIGVIPMPKYDEEQKEYCSYIFHGAGAMGIPKTNSNPERTGVIAEYLSAYAHDTVKSTYFDETLDFKYIQDEEGQQMLDIIFSNGSVDLSAVYDWGGLRGRISDSLYAGKSDIVSTVEKSSKAITRAIEKTLAAFEEVE